MKRIFKSAGLAVLAMLAFSSAVHAQATRTWVSGVGDDVNPCSRTAPCKTFAGAISKTQAGGEIDVLDPGGFGTVTITKSITIDGGSGSMASILASATNGITINALSTDTVILRNLSINGAGTTLGVNGVNLLAASNVTIDHCVFFNFSQSAVAIGLSNSGTVLIQNTTMVNDAVGVQTTGSSSSPPSVLLKEVSMQNTPIGVHASVGHINLAHSLIQNATTGALVAETGTSINVADSVLTDNAVAVQANAGGFVSISDVDMFNNKVGIKNVGGTVASGQQNRNVQSGTAGAANSQLQLQ